MDENKTKAFIGEIKKKGRLKIIVLMLLAGILLLFVGNSGVFRAANEGEGECEHDEKLNIEDYESALEEDISKFCLGVGGVKTVFTSVRLSGSSESIYAENSNNGTGSQRDEYVIIGTGSNAHPIYLGERSPEILGIGVIIHGNGVNLSKDQAEELLSAAYGVPLSRIYVKIIDIR